MLGIQIQGNYFGSPKWSRCNHRNPLCGKKEDLSQRSECKDRGRSQRESEEATQHALEIGEAKYAGELYKMEARNSK